MQKNWYIVYTKPKCEKKVASLLTKKRIENFCPLNRKKIHHLRKNKLFYEPLFDSYVFIHIEENEIPLVVQVDGLISIVYWKGRAAVIKDEEIEAVKEFTKVHTDIKLERTKINGEGGSISGTSYTMEGNVLMIKNRSLNITLPSLGFTMTAEMDMNTSRNIDVSFGNKKLQFQS